ncbi:hypothetical protein ABIB94_008867 [Bradyrhizobium sp. JR7.2]|uniref:hypothetical protein n=1 Tax=Bradyrhizobium TaxID=374 RepID=UPI0024B132D6|nr:hypothetical protein [Bradyrhizobium barranii]WFU00364.1 hypothetical protein QA633_47090 [Bradyrhizobium barranii]
MLPPIRRTVSAAAMVRNPSNLVPVPAFQSIDMRQMARRLIASTCRRICFTRAAGRQRSAYFAIFDF